MVWGAPQMQMALDRYHIYLQWLQNTPDLYILPIEQQAARTAELDQAIAPVQIVFERTELPGKADMNEKDALALAQQGLQEQYGIRPDESWRIERLFQTGSGGADENRRYSFTFQKGGDGTPLESYQIFVYSPSGKVAMGNNTRDPGGDASKTEPIATPMTTSMVELTESEAVSAAKKAVHSQYGLTDEMLTFFTASPTLDATDGKPTWTVTFLPNDIDTQLTDVGDWRWNDALMPKTRKLCSTDGRDQR